MSRDVLYLSAQGERWLVGAAAHAHAPVAVVADFVEEALVRATLPQVGGRDREALVARRLQQEFRETPFRTAYRIGAPRGARGAKTVEHVLLGLPAANALNPVLATLADAGRGVSGVWTVTLLVDAWMREARAKPAALLVVLPTPAGIRHVFLEHGRPVLSRLVPAADAPAARAELERTVAYLYNARLLERGTELPAWHWGASEPAGDVPGLRFEPAPRGPAGLDAQREGLDALLQLALRKPPAIQLAPEAARLHFIAWRMRRRLAVGAGLAAIALLALAGLRWNAAREHAARTQALEAQLRGVQAEIAQVQARYAAIGSDAQTVRDAIAAHRELIERAPAFETGLALASRGFDAAAGYRLESLRWRLAGPDAAAGGVGEEACPGADPQADPADPPAPLAGIALAGTLAGAMPLRAAVQARERFEAAYRDRPGLRLRSLRVPVDGRGGVIRGGEAGDERGFNYCLHWSPAP